MSDAELLAAIHAAPDRDEPRLVYADALLERGEPLGEYIQLQVRQARVPARSAEALRLDRRIQALQALHWSQWRPATGFLDAGTFCDWGFTRGFATSLHTTPAAFLKWAADLFRAAPLLDDVLLDCGHVGPFAMGSVPWLELLFEDLKRLGRRLAMLRLNSLDDAGAVVLAGLEGVRDLRALALGRTNLGLATFQLMGSERSSLRGLHRLELSMANARDVALEQLFARPWPALTELTVEDEVVGERGMRAITADGRLTALRALDLSWSVTGGPAIDVLAQCGSLPHLVELDLSNSAMTDAMAAALARTAGFKPQVLRLAHTGIGAAGVRAILAAPAFTDLTLLELSGVSLDEPTRALVIDRLGDGAVLPPPSRD